MSMVGIIRKPDTEEKLDILAESARYDVCLASCSSNTNGVSGRIRDPLNPLTRWIYPAYIPGKGQVGILKVLLTNVCKNNCSYCTLSAHSAHSENRSKMKRVGFAPHELADIFMKFLQKRLVHGIFISSGVGYDTDSTMQKMIRTAEILRKKYRFRGYIHLKALPGVSYNLIEYAAQLADRISMNLEAPDKEHLNSIAPDKNFTDDLLLRMKWIGNLIRKKFYTKSHTTQFVVGASDETDVDILKTTDWIYRELFIFRAYFSAFQPFNAHSLNSNNNTLLREHRLYQSDFLLRGYGFRFHDLVFDKNGELPQNVDPKTAYAMMHPELYPMDINRASEDELLKVPGIGPLSARRIVETRTKNQFHRLSELKGTGAVTKWVAPYIEFSGKREKHLTQVYTQQWLFDEMSPVGWHTGLQPYQKEKLISGGVYEYPGQKGKPIAYSASKNKDSAVCR